MRGLVVRKAEIITQGPMFTVGAAYRSKMLPRAELRGAETTNWGKNK
jgi:hypothetical protein